MSNNINSSFSNSIADQLSSCPGCVCIDPCYCSTPWPLPDVPYALPKALKPDSGKATTYNKNDQSGGNVPYSIQI